MVFARRESCFLSAPRFLFLLAALTIPDQTLAANAGAAPDPDKVRSSWRTRTESYQPIVLKAEMDEYQAERNTPERRGTPFDDATKGRQYKVDLEFALDGERIAIDRYRHSPMSRSRSKEIVVEPTQRVRTAFDGERKVTLVEEGDISVGNIESITPQRDHIAANADYLAFALWVNPEQLLTEIDWLPNAMTIEPGVQVDGYPCARFKIPRKGRSSAWTSVIDIDTANDYVPRQWQTWLGRRLMERLTIDYERDDKGNLVLKGWNLASYGEDGKVDSSRQGRVVNCEVNASIDANRFKLKFPVGTQVSSKSTDGYKLFVQTVDGLTPLNQTKSK